MIDVLDHRGPIADAAIVIPGAFESMDSALRRFKKAYGKAGILWELRKRECLIPKTNVAA
jgi:hypothetical protein